VATQNPRGALHDAIAARRADFTGADAVAYEQVATRLDDVIVDAVASAFRPAYLITGAIALLGALVLVLGAAVPLRALAAAGVIAAAAIVAAVAVNHAKAPPPVRIASPCLDRSLPSTGGLTGLLQDSALILLDKAACGYGSTREELVLALADDAENRAFQAKYHEDPRSAGGIIKGLFG
jgi:hypothetical protein